MLICEMDKMKIKKEMEELAKDKKVVFIGYNLKYGSQCYGSLKNIPKKQIIEMPVAENLMTGIAIGMSLEGYKPVLIFERHDYMLNASDQLINHLSKIEQMSDGEFKPHVIIRSILKTKPFKPDETHIQDFTDFFKKHLSFPVKEYEQGIYLKALKENKSIMGVERW